MMLDEYLFRNKKKYNAFADEIGITYRSLWNILNNGSDMKLSVALKIEKATKGEVTCIELLPKSFLDDLADKNSGSKKTPDKKPNPKTSNKDKKSSK